LVPVTASDLYTLSLVIAASSANPAQSSRSVGKAAEISVVNDDASRRMGRFVAQRTAWVATMIVKIVVLNR